MAERWRRCSACKDDIALGAIHWVCSVSTCNRKRTSLVFCNVDCWEVHLPTERHREAWAIEARAPTMPEPVERVVAKPNRSVASKSAQSGASEPAKPVIAKPAASTPPIRIASSSSTNHGDGGEILVVASKLKAYIKQASGFSTSDRVLPKLSDALRKICDESIENARRAEQQTVMGRDVPRD
jgi:hypothetical protein